MTVGGRVAIDVPCPRLRESGDEPLVEGVERYAISELLRRKALFLDPLETENQADGSSPELERTYR